MKILYDNYLQDSTVTADHANSLYPVSNIAHKFLEKVYKPGAVDSQITVDLIAERAVSCIAIGNTNIEKKDSDTIFLSQSATDIIQLDTTATDSYTLALPTGITYELQDASHNVLSTGYFDANRGITMKYSDPITARYIVFILQTDTDGYIGGISAGVPIEYPYHETNPTLSKTARGVMSRTTGGQVLGRNYIPLRKWSVVISEVSNDKRLATEDMIDYVGVSGTVYADLYDDAHLTETPMYGIITSYGSFSRETASQDYSMALIVEEAR